jgi:hypothetical protein
LKQGTFWRFINGTDPSHQTPELYTSVSSLPVNNRIILLILKSGKILIFGNIGQTFIMIAMSSSISMTLPKGQAGVGMELLSMLNFIAGGMASGVYAKVVDLGSDVHWNPANIYPNGIILTNCNI